MRAIPTRRGREIDREEEITLPSETGFSQANAIDFKRLTLFFPRRFLIGMSGITKKLYVISPRKIENNLSDVMTFLFA